MTNKYGATVDADDVHERITAFIKRWGPSYIAEMGGRKGFSRAEISMFRSYVNGFGIDKYPEDQLPALIISIPGTSDVPQKQGAGDYTAEWTIALTACVSSKDRNLTRRLLTAYMLALRAMFVQHGSIDGFVESTSWLGESYDDSAFDGSRTFQAGSVHLGIKINNVIDSASGLSSPPADPIAEAGDYGVVELADVEVEELV